MDHIFARASDYAFEFLEAGVDLSSGSLASSNRWVPLVSPRILKVNVASKEFKNYRTTGIGAVVRNFRGDFMAPWSEKVNEIGDSVWRSAVSMFRSLKFLISSGFLNVEVECNNSSLIMILNSGSECYTVTGWIVKDIRELLPSFNSISFKFVSNSCNRDAQALVGFAKDKVGASV